MINYWERFRVRWLGKQDSEQPREKVYGWKLMIRTKTMLHTMTDSDYRYLWKIYSWYLTKDSPLYNITYDKGMFIVKRDDITNISLTKTKI